MDGGSSWDLLGTGLASTDTFTDAGAGGDCTVNPPLANSTRGAGMLTVTIPTGQPAGATLFCIYADTTGAFTGPCLLGTYPASSLGVPQTFTSLNPLNGQPPAVSQSYPGASQIDPDTDLLAWYWKAPVDTAADLPYVGNNDGDVRVTQDTGMLWVWYAAGAVWQQWNPGGAVLASSQQAASYTRAPSTAPSRRTPRSRCPSAASSRSSSTAPGRSRSSPRPGSRCARTRAWSRRPRSIRPSACGSATPTSGS
jgi:hypothetical protein